ncbi:hypothetical protein G6Y98_06490 [Clostridium perfringens]|nr:nuclease domain-containing protein [Clostridium perfringens]NGT59376.1 hypothetical protein [Clostridium perfringens]NGT95445.1 hypothetical protein [Clostridium perfringens]
MVTQIKINFYKWKYENYYEIYKSEFIDFISIDSNYLGDICFEFNEYQRITIEIVSDNINNYLEIESYDGEGLTRVNIGEKHIISPGGDNDLGLVPGNYQFNVFINNTGYKGMFRVNPSNLQNIELINMKSFMEKVCEGITYNLYLESQGYTKKDFDNVYFNLEKYKVLKSSYSQIINSLNNILKNPIETINSEYIISEYSKKVDSKSLRWKDKMNGRKCLKSEFFNEKRIKSVTDNYENKIIKYILLELCSLSKEIKDQYEIYYESIKVKVDDLTSRLGTMDDELKKINFLGNVSRRKGELKRDIVILTNELNKFKEKIEKVENEINDLNRINNNLRRFLDNILFNKLFINNTKIKVTTNFIKRYDYNNIYNIYLDIFKRNNNEKFRQTLTTKKTSLLYELYIFIIVKNIFEELGFEWISGWLKSKLDRYTCDLESGEAIILKKDNYKLEIIYDRFINRVRDIKGRNISEVVSNRERRRPDILINFYENNIFIKSLVIEVKYRKKGNIYNKNIETDVMNQLIAYREFDYYDASSKNNKVSKQRVVEKIIAIFPSNDIKDYYVDETYYFQFIPIKPLEKSVTPLGYEILYKQLEEFVN